MAWTAPRTWSACEVVTAALLNTHMRDNLNQTFPALVTTKGDSIWATAANAGQRLAVGADGKLIVANSACNAGVAWDAAIRISGCNVGIGTAAPAALLGIDSGSNQFTYGLDLTVSSSQSTIVNHPVTIIHNSSSALNVGANIRFNFVDSASADKAGAGIGAQLISRVAGNVAADMYFYTNNAAGIAERMRLFATGQLGLGSSASNANMTVGVTVNQGAADDEILSFKSSDVAHGMTDIAETDTYGLFQKLSPTAGGVELRGFCEGALGAISLYGIVTTADSSRNTSAQAPVRVFTSTKSGTTAAGMAANTNLFVIDNGGNVRFIFDSDGDLSADAALTASAYDTHDDVALVRALERERTPAGVVRDVFDKWVQYSRRDLQAAKIATFNDGPGEDGSVFINYFALARLHSGAIWQLHKAHRALVEEVAQLKRLLPPPRSFDADTG